MLPTLTVPTATGAPRESRSMALGLAVTLVERLANGRDFACSGRGRVVDPSGDRPSPRMS
jgi:hypothetical protein